MRIGKLGLEVLKHFEGLHDGDRNVPGLQPKMDQPVIGIWTVGWGHAVVDPKTKKFLKGEKDRVRAYELYPNMTIEDADKLLELDLKVAENIVNNRVINKLTGSNVTLNQNAFDALISHTYNTGGSEQLFNMVVSGTNVEIIYRFFREKYISSLGKRLPGLVRRRWCEADLFKFGVVNFHVEDFR